jgi:predicted YcjX-like family ATPase
MENITVPNCSSKSYFGSFLLATVGLVWSLFVHRKAKIPTHMHIPLLATSSMKSVESYEVFLLPFIWRVWRYQRGNQNPYIEEEQTTQWPKDTKGVIRIRISKKNRQHNGQKKKYKRTNNDLQNIHIKLKIE